MAMLPRNPDFRHWLQTAASFQSIPQVSFQVHTGGRTVAGGAGQGLRSGTDLMVEELEGVGLYPVYASVSGYFMFLRPALTAASDLFVGSASLKNT